MAEKPAKEPNAIEDLVWFFGIMIVVGILWALTSGKALVASKLVNLSVTTGPGNIVHGDIESTDNNEQISSSKSANYTSTGNNTQSSVKATPVKIVYSNQSPYYQQVVLDSGTAGTADSSREYITLRAADDNPYSINITGWTLMSTSTGVSVKIGTGTELPSSDQIQLSQQSNIYLRPGDLAYIITGRSPVGGSFRVSECTGYFAQFKTFVPYMNTYSCPRILDEKLPAPPNALNDTCLDYLYSYPSCTQPIASNFPADLSHECQQFITDHENYGQCVVNHQSDAKFFQKEWRVYLNRDQYMWKSRNETIQLLDSNGKTVDMIRYY